MRPVPLLLLVAALILVALPWSCKRDTLAVGSKKFTESVLLGEMLCALGRSVDIDVSHHAELGGTRILFEGLKSGELAAYVEYTGTLRGEIFADLDVASDEALRRELDRHGIAMSQPLGFNNTYALAMRKDRAETLDVRRISDLRRHPGLRLGFSEEFMARGDGWPGLQKTYSLAHRDVRGLDHDVAYRLLEFGDLDVVDAYSTDADIKAWDLVVLEDDRGWFPRYDAVILHLQGLEEVAASWVEQMRRLPGSLDAESMTALNARVRLEGKTEPEAAAEHLAAALGIDVTPESVTRLDRLLRRTREHLDLVRTSLALAILLGVPFGIMAARRKALGHAALFVASVVQTIPALALLVLLIGPVKALDLPALGTGSAPAVTALFLYSLLPILRNTVTGLEGIPRPLRESAEALGLSARRRLLRIDLPLAAPTIVAGVKTAAVLNVGFATLGALIGAGGYGQPILTGIRLDDTTLILEGAVPAAVLALGVQALFAMIERKLTR